MRTTKVIGVRVKTTDANCFADKCKANNTSVPKVMKKFIKDYK